MHWINEAEVLNLNGVPGAGLQIAQVLFYSV